MPHSGRSRVEAGHGGRSPVEVAGSKAHGRRKVEAEGSTEHEGEAALHSDSEEAGSRDMIAEERLDDAEAACRTGNGRGEDRCTCYATRDSHLYLCNLPVYL